MVIMDNNRRLCVISVIIHSNQIIYFYRNTYSRRDSTFNVTTDIRQEQRA
jgi:hypothetical protein